MKHTQVLLLSVILASASATGLRAQDTIENYIHAYPNQQQVIMMTDWLKENQPGTFTFTGLVDPDDTTVVTPQATVNYGYSWFSVSEAPAIVTVPSYDKFFSVSVFDMKHNIPVVVANPEKTILITRPGYQAPEGDFTVVELETDQGLVMTRMVVVNNVDEVMTLSDDIKMEGGNGDMTRNVQKFSEDTRKRAEHVIGAMVEVLNVDDAFGKVSGDVGAIELAAGVMQGQLGTPKDTVRYALSLQDDDGNPLKGDQTYEVTIPAGIVKDTGYVSFTVYGTDNKLLIANDRKVYDRTSYTMDANNDGSYTITLSPEGDGTNGIPTGKDFYGVTRAYVPVQNKNINPSIRKK